MKSWTRRDVLKTGVAVSAGAVASGSAFGLREDEESSSSLVMESQSSIEENPHEAGVSLRERLLLDFGWRFHLGHADDPAKDFGFGVMPIPFAKTGKFAAPASLDFDDSAWRTLDLPHDWAVELPFVDAPHLIKNGCKPLGRDYPATSVGWYRRVFDIPASDAGKRLAIEFDGVFRNATVIFNDCFLGENLSGYAPFRFDVTNFARPGEKNVLAVRVDATMHEGWFYEGAGIYRHVWYSRTNPVHFEHGETSVCSQVERDAATVNIETVIANQSESTQHCRIHAQVLNPDKKVVASTMSAQQVVPAGESSRHELQLRVQNPALWSPTRLIFTI